MWHADDVGPPDTWTYELDDVTRDAIVGAVTLMRAASSRGSSRHRLRLWLAAPNFPAVEGTLRGGIPVRND